MRRFTGIAITFSVLCIALSGASASGATGNLYAFAYVDNPGPLTACTPSDVTQCPLSSVLHWYLYVANGNRPVQFIGGHPDRTSLPNAFVVNSVTGTITVDGMLYGFPFPVSGDTLLPPPPSSSVPGSAVWSGHWPVSVDCLPDWSCPNITSPAVLAGENLAVLYGGWGHGTTEPVGYYVFSWTIHGTLNGTPIDLNASTAPIYMG